MLMIPTNALWALLERALRREATGAAGSGTFREQMLTSRQMPCRQAEAAGQGVPKRSLTGRRAPDAPAPQQDDPGRCEAQLDPLCALPAFLPAGVVADFRVEPDAGVLWLEHALVGGVVLRVVQRRGGSAAGDGVARAERLHRRRARPQGACDPLVASVLLNPTADVVYELPERYPLIYSPARNHLPILGVAGCATGSTRPKRCPTEGRASVPLPSFPSKAQHKAPMGRKQPSVISPRHVSSPSTISANFAFWAFSELRSNNLPHSEGALDHRGGAS